MNREHILSHQQELGGQRMRGRYARLYLMAALSFIVMYVLMYAMVNQLSNVYNNFNQAYMAGLMAAPMVLIELSLMSMMYPDRRKNIAIAIASVMVGVLCWALIRQQVGIGNQQFLRSMIPHHAGAILMCEQSQVRDPDIRRLCGAIIDSQKREIAQMRALLGESP